MLKSTGALLYLIILLILPQQTIADSSCTRGESWKVSHGIYHAAHQYYDIDAWNADGSKLIFSGYANKDSKFPKLYLADGTPPFGNVSPLPIQNAQDAYWDPLDPQSFYYPRYNAEGYFQVFKFNILSQGSELIYQAPTLDKFRITPVHPSGKYLLLTGKLGSAMPAQIISLENRQRLVEIPLPYHAHRVRWTKRDNLSIFANSHGTLPDQRQTMILRTNQSKNLAILGKMTHPDVDPTGTGRISYFDDTGLRIVNTAGELKKTVEGPTGGTHGSWTKDGKFIIADVVKNSKQYARNIIRINVKTGKVEIIGPHHSNYRDGQDSHPHVNASPTGEYVIYNTNNMGNTLPEVRVMCVGE
jgi:hypothetical protein